jgi:pimeloyl-ACP methyl ester carboxylesterase
LFCLGAACIVGAGAFAAEGALHPQRLPVPEVCPCIAHMTCGDATVTSGSTRLSAWFYKPERPNGRAIILLHGVGSARTNMVGFGYFFLKSGYSVLEPDLRGHGQSAGFTTYGLLEEQDIHAWANWLFSQPGITSLYGFGASLGGSVLLESLRAEPRFRAVVAESAYSDFHSIANERLLRAIPQGWKWLASPIVTSGLWWARIRYSEDLNRASAVEVIRSSKVPVFLIHGLGDNLTSPDNSRRLAAANPATSTLWLVPGGGHANIRASIGPEFDDRVLAWLESH